MGGVSIDGSLKSRPVSDSEPSPVTSISDASTPGEAIHLRPTAALAERVLLPGDPGRALTLAQSLLVKPLMFNHHRGLWGYTGAATFDGEPLTIQAIKALPARLPRGRSAAGRQAPHSRAAPAQRRRGIPPRSTSAAIG